MIAALTKWKLAVYLTAIFSAGLVSGWVVATRTVKHQEVKQAVKQAVAPPDKEEISRWMRSSVYKLDLTPEQKPKVDAAIEHSAVAMASMHDEHMRSIRGAVSNRNELLFRVLTPEQRQRYEQLERERRDSGRNGSDSNRGRPPGPPRGDKNERGERGKGDRDRRERAVTNAQNITGANGTNDCPVTNNPAGQSQSPEPPPR